MRIYRFNHQSNNPFTKIIQRRNKKESYANTLKNSSGYNSSITEYEKWKQNIVQIIRKNKSRYMFINQQNNKNAQSNLKQQNKALEIEKRIKDKQISQQKNNTSAISTT